MASERALTERRAAVLDRIAAAAGTLADRYAIAVPDALTKPLMRDPEMGRVLQLEAFADVLDGIAAATEPQPAPDADQTEETDDGREAEQANSPRPETEGKPAKTGSAKAKVAS